MKETQKTQVRFPSQEDPLEEEMATHSSILAWEIPRTEEPCGLHGVAESDTTEHTHTHIPPDQSPGVTPTFAGQIGLTKLQHQQTSVQFLTA